jgi:mono/diheme cytochrome c family protein
MDQKYFKYASLFVVLAMVFALLAACGSAQPAATEVESQESGEEVAKPSNPGGPGQAVGLQGDATAGAQVYADQCQQCHGEQGKGGVANAGSADGDIPALNPIDSTMKNADAKVFATNIDLFIEHGSTPEGDNPAKVMPAFGDQNVLTAQQIADVIAYLISLNK